MEKKKVLILLDGSDFSKEVLPYIKDFLDKDRFHLTLFQVTDHPLGVLAENPTVTQAGDYLSQVPPQPQPSYRIYPSQQEQSQEANLIAAMTKDARALKDAGYEVKCEVRFGNPSKEILNYIKQEKIALLAMATHGRTGLNRLVMGSVAESLIQQLSIPTFLVRPSEFDKLTLPYIDLP